MTDKISENGGQEILMNEETLNEAKAWVRNVVKERPEDAKLLVRASLPNNTTTPGVSFNAPGSAAPGANPGAAQF